jgi:hypothetical protein
MPGLAEALNKKLKNVKRRLAAHAPTLKATYAEQFIREQWRHQQAAQLSNNSRMS